MPTPAAKARLGAFLLGGIALFTSILSLTVGFNREVISTYQVVFDESVTGLTEGSQVKYRGLTIGEVTGMRIDEENRVVVDIAILNRIVTINKGATAVLERASLLGALLIQIQGGDSKLGPMQEGETIRTTLSTTTQIESNLPIIIRDIRDSMERINSTLALLKPERLDMLVEETQLAISEYRGVATDIRTRMGPALDKLEAAADSFMKTSTALEESTQKLTADFEGVSGEAKQTLAKMRETLDALDVPGIRKSFDDSLAQVTRLGPAVQTLVGTMDFEVRGLARESSDAIAALKLFIQRLDRDPSAVLYGRETTGGSLLQETEERE